MLYIREHDVKGNWAAAEQSSEELMPSQQILCTSLSQIN